MITFLITYSTTCGVWLATLLVIFMVHGTDILSFVDHGSNFSFFFFIFCIQGKKLERPSFANIYISVWLIFCDSIG